MPKRPNKSVPENDTLLLKGAIFDMDGVIVDTVPLHFKAWKKMFGEYGKKFTFLDYRMKVDGIPRSSGARAVLTGLSKEGLEKASGKKQRYFLEFLKKEGVNVYKDTVDLVKRLRGNNVKTAVISSSKNCRYVLRKAKLTGLFNAIITGNDVKKGKPHPDIFLLAAARLRLKPKECIVFEDAVLGIKAAGRAKMRTVGIDRYNNPEKLKQADLVVSNLRKISISNLERLISL